MAKQGSKTKTAALPNEALEYFRQQGAKGGRLGGHLAWEGLTPAQRSARAKKASAAAAKSRQAAARKRAKGAD